MTRQPPPNKAYVARKIRECRKKKKWSQTILGDLIGVSRQTVYQWERAKFCPGVLCVYELAKAFDITIEELLGI